MIMASVDSERAEREAFFAAAGISPPPRGVDLPYDDGEPMESEQHKKQMDLLMESLQVGWKPERPFYVGGNMALYFSALQARNQDFRAPDFFAVLDVETHMRLSWVVWEEDGRTPDVVIELLSASTERNDRGPKKEVYRRLKVGAYYLFDPLDPKRFEGWRYDAPTGEYVALEPDGRGHLACPPLGLTLGVVEGEFRGARWPWLRWLDAQQKVLPTGEELAADAARRADEETRRADEETRRAREETRRADEETRRADEETRRANALTAKLAEYEKRFGKLP